MLERASFLDQKESPDRRRKRRKKKLEKRNGQQRKRSEVQHREKG
jgi:hypothetical protein